MLRMLSFLPLTFRPAWLALGLALACASPPEAPAPDATLPERGPMADALRVTRSPEHALLAARPAGSTYAALRFATRGLPRGLDECYRADGLYAQLERLAARHGRDDAGTFVLGLDVTTPDGAEVYRDLPLLVVTRGEERRNRRRACVIDGPAFGEAGQARIASPFFRVDRDTTLEIALTLKTAPGGQLDAGRRSVALARALTDRVSGPRTAASPLGARFAARRADGVGRGFEGMLAPLSAEPARARLAPLASHAAPTDTLVVDVGRALGAPAGAHQIEIALAYRSSVLGGTHGSEAPAYASDPRTLLDFQDPARGGVVYTRLRDGEVAGFDPAALSSLRGHTRERERVAWACTALDRYFDQQLALTPDDALVARYAALRAFTPYAEQPALHSATCFTREVADNDTDRLRALNAAFSFAEAPPRPSFRDLIRERIDQLIAFVGSRRAVRLAPDFALEVLGGRYLPPAFRAAFPDADDGWVAPGDQGVQALHTLLAGGARCAMTEAEPPDATAFRKLAFFARVVPESWDGFRGLRDARSMLVPMVATYTARGELARVAIGDPGALREGERINPRWPQCGQQVYAHEPDEGLAAVSAPAAQAP